MVQKVGKYGVNSGNTFRVSKSRYLRQYRESSSIIRKSIRTVGDTRASFDSGLGENDLKCDGVEFSLNKKGRWSLPKLLKSEIINGALNKQDFGVQLIERHKIARSANCISICATKGQLHNGQKQKRKGHGYLQASSVLQKKRRFSRKVTRDRLRRGLPVIENEVDAESEPSQVRYDVLYPSPLTSALTRNPKLINLDTNTYGWECYASRRRSNRHRKKVSKATTDEALRMLEDPFEDSNEENDFSDTEYQYEVPQRITLDDILFQANTIKRIMGISKKDRKSSGSSNSDTIDTPKSHIVHLDPESIDTVGGSVKKIATKKVEKKLVKESISLQKTILDPVFVILPFEQITPHELIQRFGPFYTECECFPRKFIVDISDQVSAMPKFRSYIKNKRTVNASLVIIVDEENEMNTIKDSVCKVFLNTNFSKEMESVKIETIIDYMEINLDELINRTLFYMETLPDDYICLNNSESSYRNGSSKKTNIEEFTHWSTRAYHADDEFLMKHFTGFGENKEEATELGYEIISNFEASKYVGVAQSDNRFCGVCYEELDASIPSTALIACGHWFCDKCWRDHLETRVQSGTLSLPCPEYDCDKEVDAGTAITFLTMPCIMKLAKRRHDTEVERLDEAKWCPNERCGRVLKVNSMKAKLAKCACGDQWCFDCLGEPHWPADCSSALKFKERLSKSGDAGILPKEATKGVLVHGKNCPHCKRFVEKNGGCPYMACVCGKPFCWGCGKDYSNGNLHSNCYKHGYKDNFNTQEVNVDPEDKLSTLKRRKWYKMALVHRVGQHPVKYQNMKKAAKVLGKKFKELIFQLERKGVVIKYDFELEGKTYLREADKTTDFLNSLIDLYKEISLLVENVAVLLDSEMGNKKNPLQYMANRLANFVNDIYELFVNHDGRFTHDTLDKMKQIRLHSRNTIRALVICVNRAKN